jgi:hypothetical protein
LLHTSLVVQLFLVGLNKLTKLNLVHIKQWPEIVLWDSLRLFTSRLANTYPPTSCIRNGAAITAPFEGQQGKSEAVLWLPWALAAAYSQQTGFLYTLQVCREAVGKS